MSLRQMRTHLEGGERMHHFRTFVRNLPPADRALFFRLARNAPLAGAPIETPENHGFRPVDDLLEARQRIRGMLRRTVYVIESERQSLFEEVVGLVHRLKNNFAVYVGRTYVRDGAEDVGLVDRWKEHVAKHGVEYAKVLSLVPRNRIERDEHLALALVKCWEQYHALCCNNSVIRSGGSLSDDDSQAIYICIARH